MAAMDNHSDRRRKLVTDLSISLASGLIVTGALKVYSMLLPVLISPLSLWLAGAAAAASEEDSRFAFGEGCQSGEG